MTTVAALLAEACGLLTGHDRGPAGEGSDSPRLDAELLLARILGRDRVWLRAWPEAPVDAEPQRRFRALLERRAGGEPVAYLLEQREFWSLPLTVNRGVLIPRPDTERLVELALELGPVAAGRVLDLGTGSGAIALALAHERPAWQLLGIDIDPANAALAAANAQRLQLANAGFACGSWLDALGGAFDLIVANPPYIADDDPHLRQGDVRFEPRLALVAANRGMASLEAIIRAAPQHLRSGAWLLLEHGWEQGAAVQALLRTAGFAAVRGWQDYAGRHRVSGGRWPD